MRSSYSRREFLSASSLAMVGIGFGLHGLPTSATAIPLRATRPIAAWLPDEIDPDRLRQLATHGIDAAVRAGASYADLRIADRRLLSMIKVGPIPNGRVGFDTSYGIRVLVGGQWAFAYGVDLSPDVVAHTAERAVETARRVATALQQTSGMVVASMAPATVSSAIASAPVVQGTWETPMEIDPFTVSPDEHAYLLGAFQDAAGRGPDAGMTPRCDWTKETRVFASSEGSLVTQRLVRLVPDLYVGAKTGVEDGVRVPVPGLRPMGAGFEAVANPALQDAIKHATEDATRLLGYPQSSPVQVGRYPTVMDGTSVAAVASSTLMYALESERILGYTTDTEGTSFVSATDNVADLPLFSPELTVLASGSRERGDAPKWDDEGITVAEFPLIRQGKIVDLLTTRATAPALQAWSPARGGTGQLHGTATAWAPNSEPTSALRNMTITPASSGPSLDEMIQQVHTGLLVRGARRPFSDPQLRGSILWADGVWEIQQGKIVKRMRNAVFRFETQEFWKRVTTIGSQTSMQSYVSREIEQYPWAIAARTVTAPAAFVNELMVMNV